MVETPRGRGKGNAHSEKAVQVSAEGVTEEVQLWKDMAPAEERKGEQTLR